MDHIDLSLLKYYNTIYGIMVGQVEYIEVGIGKIFVL
jgi:hypothetical protein